MKKLINLILITGITILFTSCSKVRSRNHVLLNFKVPPENITNVPGEDYEWLIKDLEGNIWWVKVFGVNEPDVNSPIYNKVLIFSADKK